MTETPVAFGEWYGSVVSPNPPCQRMVEHLRRKPYGDYLLTHAWAATRGAALRSARYRCQRCGGHGESLNVHHLSYENLGLETWADLIVLCRPCHASEHGVDP